ncbi:hypothetical protein QFC22_001631 [Naganishia vaughanmartiniae]|uniref:Uncharacterized protein n=1 Tax=Naganishia vaughanmartiniae TaxID=1424756 RepID=A0ACC2XHC0_9TREE|nr:hypothetical protein QFC22_001631 [Naganishia vaughanmartiniae]
MILVQASDTLPSTMSSLEGLPWIAEDPRENAIWNASDSSNIDTEYSGIDTSSGSLPFPLASDSSDGLEHILANPDPTNPGFPAAQGLYDPENEKDSCGVGFVCHIKGKANHKIVSDARSLLCNMTHRGASE